MAHITINTIFNIDLHFETAPVFKRLGAYAIDFVILVAWIYLGKTLLYDILDLAQENNVGIDILFISMPMLFYSLITETSFNGQTFGKMVLGIRVISMDGGEPTFGQYLLRWVTKFFEWPFVFGYVAFSAMAIYAYGFITGFFGLVVLVTIAVTKKNQRIGDLLAGTAVVDAKTNMSVKDTVFMNVSDVNYKLQFPEVMKLSDNDINTIKSVLTQCKGRVTDTALRVEYKIKDVLNIRSDLYTLDFLDKLIEDYNYLATRDK